MNKEQNILKGILIGIVVLFAAIMFWIKPSDPFQVLAIIGALSWLSILSDLLIRFFIKPKIEIITDKELEIGYSTNGPIINSQVAFISEQKSSLIKKIELDLVHENNDAHVFTWEWFEETLHEMNLPDRNITTRKNQKAVAIKIDWDEMVEKKIGFHSNKFKSEYGLKEKEVNQRYLNLFQRDGMHSEALRGSNEFNAINELFTNSFIWRVGKYKMKFNVFILNRDEPFIKNVSFELTNLDIRILNSNVEKCLKHVEIFYKLSEEEIPFFDWINVKCNVEN